MPDRTAPVRRSLVSPRRAVAGQLPVPRTSSMCRSSSHGSWPVVPVAGHLVAPGERSGCVDRPGDRLGGTRHSPSRGEDVAGADEGLARDAAPVASIRRRPARARPAPRAGRRRRSGRPRSPRPDLLRGRSHRSRRSWSLVQRVRDGVMANRATWTSPGSDQRAVAGHERVRTGDHRLEAGERPVRGHEDLGDTGYPS